MFLNSLNLNADIEATLEEYIYKNESTATRVASFSEGLKAV